MSLGKSGYARIFEMTRRHPDQDPQPLARAPSPPMLIRVGSAHTAGPCYPAHAGARRKLVASSTERTALGLLSARWLNCGLAFVARAAPFEPPGRRGRTVTVNSNSARRRPGGVGHSGKCSALAPGQRREAGKWSSCPLSLLSTRACSRAHGFIDAGRNRHARPCVRLHGCQ